MFEWKGKNIYRQYNTEEQMQRTKNLISRLYYKVTIFKTKWYW